MAPLMIDPSPMSTSTTTTTTTRPLRRSRYHIVPAKLRDVQRLVDIEFSAFENEQTNQILSFRDHKQTYHFARSINLYTKAINSNNGHQRANTGAPAGVAFKKVVDTETGTIVCFVKVEWKTYTPAELAEPADHGHEAEPRMNRDWFALNERLRREYMGTEPHCYIAMLATSPPHQHKGAGSMLLGSILAEADSVQVPVYLEATGTAKPLYTRCGFESVKDLVFDPAAYGVHGVGIERQTVMVRGALLRGDGEADGRTTERARVRKWDEVVR